MKIRLRDLSWPLQLMCLFAFGEAIGKSIGIVVLIAKTWPL